MKLSDINKFDVKTLKNGSVHISLKKSTFQKLEGIIKNAEFKINVDYTNNYVNVNYKQGSYLIEFCVGYTKKVKNHVGSSYLNPIEYDLIFTITDVSELCVYDFKNRIIELSGLELDKLTELIDLKLNGLTIEC